MIYVIGGVTYGEIATFRFIAKKYGTFYNKIKKLLFVQLKL